MGSGKKKKQDKSSNHSEVKSCFDDNRAIVKVNIQEKKVFVNGLHRLWPTRKAE